VALQGVGPDVCGRFNSSVDAHALLACSKTETFRASSRTGALLLGEVSAVYGGKEPERSKTPTARSEHAPGSSN